MSAQKTLAQIFPKHFNLLLLMGVELKKVQITGEDSVVFIVQQAIFEPLQGKNGYVHISVEGLKNSGLSKDAVRVGRNKYGEDTYVYRKEDTVSATYRLDEGRKTLIDPESLFENRGPRDIKPVYMSYNHDWWFEQVGKPMDLFVFQDHYDWWHGIPLDLNWATSTGMYLPGIAVRPHPSPCEVLLLPLIRRVRGEKEVVLSGVHPLTNKRIYPRNSEEIGIGFHTGFLVERMNHHEFYPIEVGQNIVDLAQLIEKEETPIDMFRVHHRVYDLFEELSKLPSCDTEKPLSVKRAVNRMIKRYHPDHFRPVGPSETVAILKNKNRIQFNFYMSLKDAYERWLNAQIEESNFDDSDPEPIPEPDASPQEEVGA